MDERRGDGALGNSLLEVVDHRLESCAVAGPVHGGRVRAERVGARAVDDVLAQVLRALALDVSRSAGGRVAQQAKEPAGRYVLGQAKQYVRQVWEEVQLRRLRQAATNRHGIEGRRAHDDAGDEVVHCRIVVTRAIDPEASRRRRRTDTDRVTGVAEERSRV